MAEVTRELIEKVKAARDLISVPRRWARGRHAYNADGHPVHPSSDEACSWCSSGALWRVAGEGKEYVKLFRAVCSTEAVEKHGLISFNDQHSHPEVMQHWSKIILDLEAQLEEQSDGTAEV